jgi:hypothetical protein
MTMTRFFSLPLALAALVTATFLVGCGGADDRPAPSADTSFGPERQDLGGKDRLCNPGERIDCHKILSVHNGVTSCFWGVQECNSDGRGWSECFDPNVGRPGGETAGQ